MKLLVTGVSGQVGYELMRSLQPLGEVVATDAHAVDFSRPDSLNALVDQVKPNVIINPAAYTAVDKAEEEEALALAINGTAPAVLAEAAKRHSALLIHYSTDYVFDGTKQGKYEEDDATCPQNAYGRTKLAGELALADSGADYLVLRTSWVYASRGKNFLKTMLKLAQERETLSVVADQIGAPTSARLLADTTAQIVRIALQERQNQAFYSAIHHLVAQGETSWHGFAEAIIAMARERLPEGAVKVGKVQPIPSSAYPTPAKRPANSRLSTVGLEKRFGLTLPAWENGLALTLEELFQ